MPDCKTLGAEKTGTSAFPSAFVSPQDRWGSICSSVSHLANTALQCWVVVLVPPRSANPPFAGVGFRKT
jgi:hypothetical protein